MNPFLDTLIYFIIGIVFCGIGYKFFDLITPFDLDKEIEDHNIAAGLTVAGIFIGVAIVLSITIL
ncbi:DUF350 domain-containing protein [Natronospora cellulosivora (SeqCode)]